MSDVMIIGLAGGTGSGKTTITKKLMQRFGGEVSVIYHDNYYKAHHDMPYEERAKLNYDHPDAFDNELCSSVRSAISRPGRTSSARSTTTRSTTAATRPLSSKARRSSSSRASSSTPCRSCAN